MKYLSTLIFVALIAACNQDNQSVKSKLEKPKNQELDVSFLDDINKDGSLIEFKDLEKQTPKLQKLVKECLDVYKNKSTSRFRYTTHVSHKKMPFDESLRLTISLQEEKKNRFDEIYYENSDCEWYGDEYKLVKKKSQEEIIKISKGEMKLQNR